MMKNSITILAFILGLVIQTQAQSTFSIAQGGTQGIDCGSADTFTDSDADAGNYAAGEILTMTFCPNSGNAVTLLVAPQELGSIWDVSGSDVLYVYDGTDDSAPLLGAFNSSSHPTGFTVTSTLENTSGCLTFVFESSPSSPGGQGWTGVMDCGTSWQPFTVEIDSDPAENPDLENYVDVCQDTEITLTATGDYPFAGQGYSQDDATSYFVWDLGDGTMIEGEGVTSVSHTWPGAFGYFVSCTVTDSQGQVQVAEFKVRISTTPSFAGTSALVGDMLCLGNEGTLVGGVSPDTMVTFGFNTVPSAFVGGGFFGQQQFLPDGAEDNYETTIIIDDFETGQLIENPDDIIAMCINMEHSFLGDLEMTLTCPDGTSITIFNSFNGADEIIPGGFGGGGTYLGIANDDGGTNPGIGSTYCFTSTAAQTLGDALASGGTETVTFDDGNGNTNTGQSMIPGDYLPENLFDAFIGCPINGPWTVTVRDNLLIDNGYIFNWSIQFNPLIDPTAELYTPMAVSEFWSDDPSIVFQTDTFIVVDPETTGFHDYMFNIVDDFGCAYDTTIIIEVLPPVAISGMSPACDFSTVIDIVNSEEGGAWTWTSDNPDILSTVPDTDGEAENISAISGVVTYEYYDTFCDRTESIDIFYKPYPVASIIYNDEELMAGDTIELCLGDETLLMNVDQPESITDPIYNWLSPIPNSGTSELLVSADFTNQTDAQTMNGPYTVTVVDAQCPDTQASQQIIVSTEGCQPYNVFSPLNQDGFNDVFFIGGVERLRNSRLWIYNRWGKVVFEATNYKNDYRMEDLSEGTYYYVLQSDSKGGEFKGYFTLVGDN
jgi:gliding motility-associated-like protein